MVAPGPKTDTAIIAWQYWVLRTVQLAGVAVPQIDEAFKMEMAYFAGVQDKDSRSRKNRGGYGRDAPKSEYDWVLCS